MSVIFQSGQFEYQLPTALGASPGAAITLQPDGSLGFSPAYAGLCSIDFSGTVLANCGLTISTCGSVAQVFLSAPTSGETRVLQFAIDGSGPQWGSLVNANPAIPAALLPVGAAALGVVALLKNDGGGIALKQLYVSLTGTGTTLAPGLISLSAVLPLEAGTYVLGGLAQLSPDGAPQSVYLGSYVRAS